jgi:hypothetical protein
MTVQTAAEAAGISRRTATRRMADPAFLAVVQACRRQFYQLTLSRLAAAGAETVDVLLALLRDGPPAVKLGAARTILESTNRWREAVELGAELAELREQLEGLRHGYQGPEKGAGPPHRNGTAPRP